MSVDNIHAFCCIYTNDCHVRNDVLYIGIFLLALCLADCNPSESTDLRLFELKGNVHSVQSHSTIKVDSLGNSTKHSFKTNGHTHYFDRRGRLIFDKENYQGERLHVTRNAAGNIDTISYPCKKPDGEWNGSGYTDVYTWNEDGYPIWVSFSNCVGDSSIVQIIYNESNEIVKRIECNWSEGSEIVHLYTIAYTILEVDAHGNWTKRLEHMKYNEESSIILKVYDEDYPYTLVERTITYY